MFQRIIIREQGIVRFPVVITNIDFIIRQHAVQLLFCILYVVDKGNHSVIIGSHDMGQCHLMYIHNGLVNLSQMVFSFHIVVSNICGIVIDIFDIYHCQQIGYERYYSKQGNGQY